MKVRRSRLEVLRILAYAENHGLDATAERYGVDTRTLKRWVERDPPGWRRDSEMARLAANEKYYSGGSVSLVQARTDAGINARNDRYEQLIARREARGADEAPPADPVRAAADALSDEQRKWLRDRLDREARLRCYLRRNGEPEEPEGVVDTGDGPAVAYIRWVLASSANDLAAADAAEDERARAALAGWRVFRLSERRWLVLDRDGVDTGWGQDSLEWPATLLPVVDERAETPALDVTPSTALVPSVPAAPVSAPRARSPLVIDTGEPWQWEPWIRE